MKSGDFYMKLVIAVVFLSVLSYFGIRGFNAIRDTYVTASVAAYTIEEAFLAEGFIVRSETVMQGSSEILPMVNEGEKLAAGQVVAVEYFSRAAYETAGEIRALKLKIAQFESSGNTPSLESANMGRVMELSKAINSGNLGRLDEHKLAIETTVFSSDDLSEENLPEMRAQLLSLERRSSEMTSITAPHSGYFSQGIDGFEHISPQDLADLTPSGLDELFRRPSGSTGSWKLIDDFKWYYAATMQADEAFKLPHGRPISVQFTGAYQAMAEMYLEYISRREDDKCVVLFSSERAIHEVTMMRHLSADVIHGVVSGIRIPKEEIHLDEDGTTFVYLETGVRAERVNVEILRESGDSYLVRDGLETNSPLRVGSTIIVKANNLFDGKIVKE